MSNHDQRPLGELAVGDPDHQVSRVPEDHVLSPPAGAFQRCLTLSVPDQPPNARLGDQILQLEGGRGGCEIDERSGRRGDPEAVSAPDVLLIDRRQNPKM